MGRRITGAVLLLAASSSAVGFEVSVAPTFEGLNESDGVQRVSINVSRGPNDGTAACTIDVDASTQDYSGAPSEAATANEGFDRER